MRSLPWQNYKNWTPFCSGEKIFNFSTRDPDHLHALASRVYGAIFSKNRFFGTTHGDKPTSQNGISLRSPSLIMAPGRVKHFWSLVSSCYFTDLRKNLLRRMWRVCTFKTFSPSPLNFFLKLKYLAVKTESVELMRTGTAKSTFSQSPGA